MLDKIYLQKYKFILGKIYQENTRFYYNKLYANLRKKRMY